jgi:hypothetical protein
MVARSITDIYLVLSCQACRRSNKLGFKVFIEALGAGFFAVDDLLWGIGHAYTALPSDEK